MAGEQLVDLENPLAGGGEMGRLMRAHDWSATPLGPVLDWPQSLKTAVRIILGSRYPMFIWWGKELTNLYNDGYLPMLGQRHPSALGKSAAVIWSEIWDTIGPQTDAVLYEGRATWNEERLLVLERNGYREEAYFTFCYSPIPADGGGIGGIFCALTEDTQRVLGQRRMRTLRELSARTNGARTVEQACQAARDTLAQNLHDLPFALIYLVDGEGHAARLFGTTGLVEGSPACPSAIALFPSDDGSASWPLDRIAATGRAELVKGLEARFGPLRCGVWPDTPQSAIVLPVMQSGHDRLAGFLVAGISPRRVFDDDYRGFTELLAGQIATAVTNARAYEEERRRAEALAELDRAKTAFFSNVSHEFRTPLTLILGPVEDALAEPDGSLPSPHRERLEIAYRNGLRLQKLVNALLDFSRIEAGRVQASYEPTDLAWLTAELASNFRSASERAGLDLVVDCRPLPEPVYVDRDMWEKIVLNLLSNAFKFTMKGKIEVTLRRVSSWVELAVRDTGAGIPAAEMPKLFERFHRVEGTRGRTQEGSGIGLALVRELVRLHGGDVRVESKLGKGSVFIVSLPRGLAHLPADRVGLPRTLASTALGAAAYVEEALRWLPDAREPGFREPILLEDQSGERSATADVGGRRRRILVADDNADMRDYLRRLLAGRYDVECVADGQAAWVAAENEAPDLVLADVMMPGLDGFGLLRQLRANARTREAPVILLSARAGEDSRIEGLEAGADDYLVKPFSARELLARVQSHLELAKLRREAQEVLKESENRVRLAQSVARLGIFEWNIQTGVNTWTPELEAIYGLKPGEFGETQAAWERLVHPNDLPAALAKVEQAIESGQPTEHEWRIVGPGGIVRWVAGRFQCFKDAQGKPLRMSGVNIDITDRKAAEETKERLAAIVESSDDAVISKSMDGVITSWNRAAERLYGYSADEIIGRPISTLIPPDHTDDFPSIMERLRRGERIEHYDTVRVAKDGRRIDVSLTISPLKDALGNVVGASKIARDVSERKRADTALRKHSERARLLSEAAGLLLATSEPDAILKDLLSKIGASLGLDFSPLLAGGRPVGASSLASLSRDHLEPEEVEFLETISHYVTAAYERIGLIKQLREQDRRKDEFLATLAHELRNPLAPIRNGLQLIRLAGQSPALLDQAHPMMERQLQQMVRLVDDLLDVSRINQNKLELRKEWVELAAVILRAVETSRPLIEAASHQLTVSVPPEPVLLDADPVRLAQAISNLLNNAAKYSERGGRIWLTAELANGGRRPAREVLVRVRDTGVGIPPDMLPHIFEMFMQEERSLERSQGGLGIGLTLVQRLIQMHGGRVEARSEGAGKGSEFIVRLPVVIVPNPKGEHDGGGIRESARARVRRRILVVDDNRDSADSLAMMLKLLGDDVVTAHDGLAALERVSTFQPDVALLDLGMPKLNGYDAARLIRQQPCGQGLVLIAMTGWGQDEDIRRSREAGFDFHLVKPIELAALEKLIAGSGSKTA